MFDLTARKGAISQLKISIEQKAKAQDILGREPMGKKRFIAFLRYHGGEEGLDTRAGTARYGSR